MPGRSSGRLAAILALAATPAAAGEITVFAASSMTTAMEDVAGAWKEETGNTATLSFAASSALARQIQQGAPADVYVSANIDWMDTLEADGRIEPETRRNIVRNDLVLVAEGGDPPDVKIKPGFDLAGMLGDGRLAMALVNAVPAGIYGKAALQNLHIWEEVRPKVAQTDNVRAALRLVATGEAPMGVVYATDAVASDRVSVAGTFPAGTHPPIIYPAAETSESDSPLAADFLDFLESDAATQAFERQGFEPIR